MINVSGYIIERAAAMGIPLSVQMDLTYRCNERCVHCYLDHDDHGELTTEEVFRVLDELAAAGTFNLTFSGGEIMMRRDLFAILGRARELGFNLKLKSNAVMITAEQARQLRDLRIDRVQVSVYSHRAEVHDAITKLPGSWRRSIAGIRRLKAEGLRVAMANVLMTANLDDYKSTQRLAEELGVIYVLDPTITPMMDGDTAVLSLRAPGSALHEVMRDPDFAAMPDPVDEASHREALGELPCSAGHTSAYISPYGDVFPCVQFPIKCGNVREQGFSAIWRSSTQLAEVRAIRMGDLTHCSSCHNMATCTRCPGLAYMEGDMRGPSSADCEKSLVRTGVLSANMRRKLSRADTLVQIHLMPAPAVAHGTV